MNVQGSLKQQGTTASLISNFIANVKKTAVKSRTKHFIEARRQLLESYWQQFFQTHMAIVAEISAEDKGIAYFKDDHFNQVEILYTEHMGELSDLLAAITAESPSAIDKVTSDSKVSAPTVTSSIPLPRIPLPSFNGIYTQWPEFRDVFNCLVGENNALTDVQRLQYLKSSCTGEAAVMLSNLPNTSANFSVAWETLTARYQNKRMIVYSYFRDFLDLPTITKGTSTEISQLLDGTIYFIRAVKAQQCPVDKWDDWIVYMLIHKFDPQLRRDWELAIQSTCELPQFSTLQTFLEGQLRAIEFLITPQTVSSKGTTQIKKVHTASTNDECALCRQGHFIRFCNVFKNYSIQKRRDFVLKNELCFNCLKSGHMVSQCTSTFSCRTCAQRHNSMLHVADELKTEKSNASRDAVASHHAASKLSQNPFQDILLSTADVIIEAPSGKKARVRALIDQGSQATFISKRLAKRLRLNKEHVSIPISGIGGTLAGNAKFSSKCVVRSRNHQNALSINALIIEEITSISPSYSFDSQACDHLKGIALADPNYSSGTSIDLLLGADVYGNVILQGLRKGLPGTPIAQQSIFGWLLNGPNSQPEARDMCSSVGILACCSTVENSFVPDIRRFWEVEEIPTDSIAFIPAEDQACEDHFINTHQRNHDGRYTVDLPLLPHLNGCAQLGESRLVAERRLKQVEHRMRTNAIFSSRYRDFMTEYLSLGHMEPALDALCNSDTFYLPHHGITKEQSSTTKLRVVFDGSQKSSNGFSLNDRLCNGPKLQYDLFHLILKWRKLPVVFMADIEKMYRQIRVTEKSANLQRIVWRDSSTGLIQTYKLTTVTYGTKPAAYLAIRVLKQLALDEKSNHPSGAKILDNDLYVDDVLSGADDVLTAKLARDDLINILKSGGFTLKKWASNKIELLNDIPLDHRETGNSLRMDNQNSVNALGFLWQPIDDFFHFKVDFNANPVLTKRGLLSDIARLFDPLGWIAPVIVSAKILFQKLWLLQLDWDDSLPFSICQQWEKFRKQLESIQRLRIPRWLSTQKTSKLELHLFCDASEHAYATVAYLRVVNDNNRVHCCLLAAKTKLAPIKQLSIPRLELCGALLLSKLAKTLLPVIDVPDIRIVAWTDSTIVLHWLNSQPNRWKCFVANRIGTIQRDLPQALWRHVPSIHNPADCASRGLQPPDILEHLLWWNGPSWITLSEDAWPVTPEFKGHSTIDEETKTHATVMPVSITPTHDFIKSCSSLDRLCRITAYCQRFANNSRIRISSNRQCGSLTYHEIFNGLQTCIKIVQQQEFPTDYMALKNKKEISKQSKIKKLNPFLENGLLRVGSRLQNSALQFNEKFPIILPKSHHFTKLVIREAHVLTLHGGPSLT